MQIRKKGDEILKKSSLKLLSQSQPNFAENDPWVVPFQNCVRQRRPVSKMTAITKDRYFFKWPKTALF